MANFKTHLIAGVITSSFATGYLYNSGLEKPIEVLPFITLGVIGTFLPDIDSDNSTSLRIVFKVLAVVLPSVIIIKLSSHLSVIQLIVVTLITIIFLWIILFVGLSALTVHRGIIHSVPTGIMFSLATICIFQKVPLISNDIPLCAGIILFTGFITHLILDELFSFNLAGLQLKRSFGTALKFIFIGDFIPALLMYLSILILYFQSIGVDWLAKTISWFEIFSI